MNKNPDLLVICGPMKSGKSRQLLTVVDSLLNGKKSFKLFKPVIDNLDKGVVISRYRSLKWDAILLDKPSDIHDHLKDIDLSNFTVCMDEVQFFDNDLLDVIKDLRAKGCAFVIAGLDTNSDMQTFKCMGDVLALATEVKKLRAWCEYCWSPSTLTFFDETQQIQKTGDILITGKESTIFKSVCHSCYHQEQKKN